MYYMGKLRALFMYNQAMLKASFGGCELTFGFYCHCLLIWIDFQFGELALIFCGLQCSCFSILIIFLMFQIRENPAALLALCWYWATDGKGSKVLTPSSEMYLLNRLMVLKQSSIACLLFLVGFCQDMVVLPYKDSLLLFSRYLQQLVMESLGKEFDLDGNRVCSTDQYYCLTVSFSFIFFFL